MSGGKMPNSDEPLTYHIKLKGHLAGDWDDWFGGATITLMDDGSTLLTCQVMDQAVLYGLLRQIRDLGLPLISVNTVHHS
jgi:hypothetical protein